MILVLMNHRLFTTESKSTRLSIMRFYTRVSGRNSKSVRNLTCELSSNKTWSYSLKATQKMIDVTFSKQCIHFLRSLLWPPTSNMLFQISLDALCVLHMVHVLNAQLTHCEPCFVYTCRFGTRSQHVGFYGYIVGVRYSFYLVEEAATVRDERKNSACSGWIDGRTMAPSPSDRTRSSARAPWQYKSRSTLQ